MVNKQQFIIFAMEKYQRIMQPLLCLHNPYQSHNSHAVFQCQPPNVRS